VTEAVRCLSGASFWQPKFLIRSAWLEHAPFAFWLVDALRPSVLVELGTHSGFSYLAFCQAVGQLGLPARCFSVDTWEGDVHAGFYDNTVFEQLNELNQRHHASFSELIRARFDQAVPRFEDGSIDLLHIDGRHGYDDVREDFVSWLPKLSNRAVVLFHDTAVRERDFGVWQLWEELATRFPSFQFPHGHGLGVLGVGREPPEAVRPLFTHDPATIAAIRAAYARLGSAVPNEMIAVSARAEIERLTSLLSARDAA
jgi:hypothetical protein